jgi:protein TonB
MQATISRSGSVMGLHVVKGPPALRRAALDAVRQWRYRPYTVDGRPVDVSTMVYVDFALRASPTIVR